MRGHLDHPALSQTVPQGVRCVRAHGRSALALHIIVQLGEAKDANIHLLMPASFGPEGPVHPEHVGHVPQLQRMKPGCEQVRDEPTRL